MSWYAVHTRSRHEDRVHARLTQKSIDTFLPKMEVWSRRKDRRKRIQVPLFSGYLFVNIEELTNERKLDVLTTAGVVRILGRPDSSRPEPVPDEQIEAVQRLVNSDVELQPFEYPRAGEPARIVDGPFKGIEGTVISTDYRKNLFVVSIDILQRSVAIRVEGFQIEKV
ncbi:MAG: UpxY family transcription antiterminator [Deltaproteobacteria bacterium]|nr:UpxY family transcription antiterminator [Deltaproteobacteria bacterium]